MAAGDRGALATLYDRYAAAIHGLALRVLGGGAAAEDLVHDVFMEAWRSADTFDPTRGSVRAWLFVRARSRALDRVRAPAQSRAVSLDQTSVPEPQEAADELSPDRRALREALAALPESYRDVLWLGYFRGLSSSEIAAEVGVPVGTVKSRVRKGFGLLRAGFDAAPSKGDP